MVSKINPVVTIMLDKERHLRFDLNAMAAFEEATGKNIFEEEVVKKIINKTSPRDLRALLWSMILHEDEALTIKQVGAWVNINNVREATLKAVEAWASAMPKAERDKDKVPLAQKPSAG